MISVDLNSPLRKLDHNLNQGDICDFPQGICLNTHYTLHNGMICSDDPWMTNKNNVDTIKHNTFNYFHMPL